MVRMATNNLADQIYGLVLFLLLDFLSFMNLAIEMLEFLMKFYSVHTVQPSVILTQVHFTILAVF